MPCLMVQEYIGQAGQLLVGFEPGCLLHGNRDRKLLRVLVRGHQQGMHPMLISGRRVLTAMGGRQTARRRGVKRRLWPQERELAFAEQEDFRANSWPLSLSNEMSCA